MLSIVEYDYNTNFRRLNNDQNVFHNALRYVLKGEKRFHVEGDGYDYDLVYEDNDVRAKKDPAFPDSDFFLSEMLYPPYYFYDENDLSKINLYLLDGFDEIFFEEANEYTAVIAGLVCVILIAIMLGRKEKAHLKETGNAVVEYVEPELSDEEKALLRPHLFVVNIILIIAAILCLLFSGFPPAVVFMVFYVLATLINYPKVADSKARVDAHAKSCLMMCSVLFAAGCFTGIMKSTGMITAMSEALVSVIPATMGKFFAVIVGIIACPASLLFDPDSFYFGVLPVLSETAKGFGVSGASIGRAAILGQMTVGFPISPLTAATFLLTGLSGVDLGEHQRKTLPLAWGVSIVMLIVALLTRGVTM